MRVKTILKTLSVASLLASSAIATAFPGFVAEDYTQVISVNNALANKPNEVSVTRTPIHVEYFTSDNKRCWWNDLQFGEGVTIHAGSNQGCQTKVTRVTIEPKKVIEGKRNTYEGVISVNIDAARFSNMITVKQDRAPIFNTETGMVETSGTITTSNDVTFR